MDRPTEATATPSPAVTEAPSHEAEVIERLDRALLRMRRVVVRPEITSVPIPAAGRTIDIAKVMACLAIADLAQPEDHVAPVAVKDVAATLALEHSTTSRLLAETETAGLVRRRTDPADRRRTTVELTATGRAVVEQSAAIRTWAIDNLLSGWEPADVVTFTELIERFTATIDARIPDVVAAAVHRFGETPTPSAPPPDGNR